MDIWTVCKSTLSGSVKIPSSKSHSQRALLFAMMGSSKSELKNLLPSPDCKAMEKAITQFGAKANWIDDTLEVQGGFSKKPGLIDAGNSGQILRFLAGLSALAPFESKFTGDHSIQTNRPMKSLCSALSQIGAVTSGTFPISIQGPIKSGKCSLSGEDSQCVSALLIATSFLDGSSEIFVENPKETPWIDLTLDWIERLGGKVDHQDYKHYKVKGGLSYSGFQYTIPGDFSSAAFPIAAALITQSSIELSGLEKGDVQGDKIFIDLMQKMGGQVEWKNNLLCIKKSELTGIEIDVDACIDAIPILAVLGCFAKGTTKLYNGAIARQKESDRISTITNELKKMGALIEELDDGLIIHQSPLKGAIVDSHEDHRIALALSVAGMGAFGKTQVKNTGCIAKSYPSFFQDFKNLGAKIELDLVRV